MDTNRQGQTAAERAAYEQAGPDLGQVRVVEADPSHYPILSELTLRAYEPVSPSLYSGGYAEELADVAGRAVDVPILVALFGDFVIGGVTYVPDDSTRHYEFDEADAASFRHLAVDPSAQGLGAGLLLVEACLARARADDKPTVLIHSMESMTAARRLYEQFGFVRDETLDRQWSDADGWGYRLNLS